MADDRLGYDLTPAPAATPLRPATVAIIGKGEFQNDGKDHQSQQHSGGDDEEMAFDHADMVSGQRSLT